MGDSGAEAERAKRALSSESSARVEVESLAAGRDFSETVTRAKFEELCDDLITRCKVPVENALRDAKLSLDDMDEEEWARSLPAIELRLKAFFGRNTYKSKTFYRVIGGLNEALQEAIRVLNDGTFNAANLAHKTF